MGVSESSEEALPTIRLLAELPQTQVESALLKLEELSRRKYEMQVSKWDLLVILSLKSIEVKKVM